MDDSFVSRASYTKNASRAAVTTTNCRHSPHRESLARRMANDDDKRRAARAALQFVTDGMIVGVGTGSTVGFFIEALADKSIAGAVSSSQQTTRLLEQRGIRVLDLNDLDEVPVY